MTREDVREQMVGLSADYYIKHRLTNILAMLLNAEHEDAAEDLLELIRGMEVGTPIIPIALGTMEQKEEPSVRTETGGYHGTL